MAKRARLSAPRHEPTTWQWHEAEWTSLPSNVLTTGERRMEGESYLLGGYGVRLAFRCARHPLKNLSNLAAVWQPSRLKGIQVSREYGTPFLAATQVFDLRPRPRKFLSLDRTDSSAQRFVKNGTILVTCSGTVGRATLAYAPHERIFISHDLLRVEPRRPELFGWVYFFLRSSQARAMMGSAQYGHIIKHLEASHLDALPIPCPRNEVLAEFNRAAKHILTARNKAWALQTEAEETFAEAVGPVSAFGTETGFTVLSADSAFGRRRLEASYHSPVATSILRRFRDAKLRVEALCEVTNGVWWKTRFKRIFGDGGVPYLSADDLFSINPGVSKRVLLDQADNADDYFVKAGWIVMACSGQTYGLNGSVSLMTKRHEESFFSHDLIRIVPKLDAIRPGYLFTVLGHPLLGRPLVIRNAYGTSIPHLEPEDITTTPIVRLSRATEDRIADLTEEAVNSRVDADATENDFADRASELNNQFLAGDMSSFSVTEEA